MRKCLFLMIALFVTGQVCKAQHLLAGQKLKTEKKVTIAQTHNAPLKTDAAAKEYWVTSKSHYDEYGQYLGGSDLRDCNYVATLAFDGDDVTISGLIDVTNYEGFSPSMSEIHGHYDATAHTVTIQTPTYDTSKEISSYTKVGTMTYYGSDVTMVLFAGNFTDTPNASGQYEMETVSELVFDVSEDLSTLTSRTGFGCYSFYNFDNSAAGFIDFYKTSTLSLLTSEPKFSVSPSTITFEGASVTVGATLTSYVSLTNQSTAEANYTVNIDGDGLLLYASNKIGAKATKTYKVVLKPTKVGQFDGKITFIASNGSTATTEVKANVAEAPDFSEVVKEGDFVFSYGDDNPFAVTDTITGYPVAVSTSEGSATSSTLNVGISVPKGKTGIVSWKGTSVAMQPNGVKIYLDDDEIYNNTYSYNGILAHDDISNVCVVGNGDHLLSFVTEKTMDWYASGLVSEPFRTWVYDLSLKLIDDCSDAVVAKDSIIDFGRHYFDNLSVSDTAVVRLVNAGSNELRLTGVTGTDNFTAVVDGASAAFGTELPVNIVFTGNAIGNYNEDIVLHTTAGDFTVSCAASVEKVIYDYSPIVTEGTFSFNTSFDFPFIVENDSARSDISGLDPSGIDLTAWLEATFEVPEGQEGILSWKANNSSTDFFTFMNVDVLENGSYITMDGENRKEFAGVDEDCSSSVYDDASLIFQAGRHNIRFSYQKINTYVDGHDRLVVSKLGLHLQASGIRGVDNNRKVVKTEIYSVDGKKLNSVQSGLNIIRRVYSDGTSETVKRIVRQ